MGEGKMKLWQKYNSLAECAQAEAADADDETGDAEPKMDSPKEPEEAATATKEPEVAAATSRQACDMATGQTRSCHRLRVEVKEPCGSPVEVVEVAVWDLDTNTKVSETVTTDSQGTARLVAPANKTNFVLRIQKAGYIAQER